MPKKAGKKAAPAVSEPTILSSLFNKGLHEVVLITLTGVTLYLLLALTSYNLADDGWVNIRGVGQITNFAGPAGAWLADLMLTLFGYLAFTFPLLTAVKAWRVLRDKQVLAPIQWRFVYLRLFGFVLLMVAGCALLSAHFVSDSLAETSGGILGQEVASITIASFSMVGATLILFCLFLVGLTVFADVSWITVSERLGALAMHISMVGYQRLKAIKKRHLEKAETKKIVSARKEAFVAKREAIKERKPPTISAPAKPAEPSKRAEKEKQRTLFKTTATGSLPKLSLLDAVDHTNFKGYSAEALEAMSRLLELKLKDFNVDAEVVAVQPGPVITRFEIQPAPGVKVSKITNLAKDLARSLAVISVRVVEVIPGKTVVGIEIPNENREMIRMTEVVSSRQFDDAPSPLTMALGKDIAGDPVVADLSKMPHLLVAGTTGSGKSVGLNCMLMSILFKASPEQVRLIMIDPKMLELAVYEGIPHLLTPVVTDMKQAASALRWGVAEMERRYQLMAALGVRNIAGYNKKVSDAVKSGSPLKDPLWRPLDDALSEEPPELESLPYIVIVIDEFADMMMIVGKKVEELIARIAQKARAAGIHLILATQRPSVDVITGLIKANVPSRIGFQVSSKIDSRTVLDQGGAEQLLGHGDMLYLPAGSGVPERVHGAFVDDDEVHRVCNDWRERSQANYLEEILDGSFESSMPADMSASGDDSEQDELYDQALAFVTETRRASISSVQRKFKIGYNRAARLIESMEASGVVSPPQTNGSREVLAPPPVAG